MNVLKKIFRGDKIIWIIYFIFCFVSIIEVFSAGSLLSYKSGNHLAHFLHHFKHVFVGFLIVVFVQRIPHQVYKKMICIAYLPMVVCLAVLFVKGLGGHNVNDGARWLFGVQPSEFAKGLVVMLVALILSKQRIDGVSEIRTQYCMIFSGLVIFLIFPENGSTACLLALVVFLMLLIGRASKRIMLKWIGCGLLIVGVVVCAYFVAPKMVGKVRIFHRLETQIGRVDSWTEKVPAAKYVVNDKNRQHYHAMRAITTSGILGKGPGNSVERDELSQAYSDLIFAVIVEELGLLPAAIVVLCYFWLLLRVFKIAQKCTDLFHSLLVVGLGILMVSQALFNMMVAVDLAPITGQTLPFISRGGSSILVNCSHKPLC